jgi:hypothetical protein
MGRRLKPGLIVLLYGTSKLVPFLPEQRGAGLRKGAISVLPNGQAPGLRIQAPEATFAFPAKRHDFSRAVSTSD